MGVLGSSKYSKYHQWTFVYVINVNNINIQFVLEGTGILGGDT